MNTLSEQIRDTQADVESLALEIRPIFDKQMAAMRHLTRLRSLKFIEDYKVTLDDVEQCSGDGKPYFWEVKLFMDWCREHSTKRFAEWNGILCPMDRFTEGEFRGGAGRFEDVPGYSEQEEDDKP